MHDPASWIWILIPLAAIGIAPFKMWLKIKTHGRQEFVICGWTKGQGRREGSFAS